jgi:CheY-like chemotaxis protein
MAGILFIDAEQPFSDKTAGALRERGFEVTHADGAKDVVEQAAKDRPDLIVLCVELPKVSGYSICNRLKKDAALKAIPLIITSKEATPDTFAQHKKLKTRAEEYLIKPFSEQELLEKIGALGIAPANGVAEAEAAPPPAEDAFGDIEALDAGADVSVDLSISGVDAGSEQVDELLEGLDGLDGAPAGGATAAPVPSVGDGIEGLDGLEESADLDFEKPRAAGASSPSSAASQDPALDVLAEAEVSVRTVRPASMLSRPPSAPVTSTSSADLAALQAMRRDNSDLKTKVAELEARLRNAEEAARAAASASMPPTGAASTAREVLNLKQQLRAKDDEILQKEQSLVDTQEQLERLQFDINERTAALGEKDVEISSLKARVESLTTERDDLEIQVRDRLQLVESERDQLQADLESLRLETDTRIQQLDSQLQSVTRARDDLNGRVRSLEQENKAAQEQLRDEERLRQKGQEAAKALVKLLAREG